MEREKKGSQWDEQRRCAEVAYHLQVFAKIECTPISHKRVRDRERRFAFVRFVV